MLDAFHRFPSLPVELRLQIWSWSFLHKRVIKVSWRRFENRDNPHHSWHFSADQPSPAQAQVNREARYEALRYYTTLFCIYYPKKPEPSSYLYIAPEIDVIRISEATIRFLSVTDKKHLRRIILDVEYDPVPQFPIDVVRTIERLEEIELVFWPKYLSKLNGPRVVNDFLGRFIRHVEAHPRWQMPLVKLTLNSGKSLGYLEMQWP
ncbi:hypothetical protein BO78DRAFT_445402 [Aspergillus sclerotiicarbonarius CBS 121057]|uniref:2EXR domain-containing protein n=1 Tax=Aspergillus sclerotiicarbonarius (strain CBS 121057 / IBT 28362) TaxID=1448318 RepID=A0A319EWS5_ASPSB|nr:hypothetical protein BO78DRAFT_445402 [Aspergillus sclerotiicarbonarius CBS 121057]